MSLKELKPPQVLTATQEVTGAHGTGQRWLPVCGSLWGCDFCPTPHLEVQGFLLLPPELSALAPDQLRVVQS